VQRSDILAGMVKQRAIEVYCQCGLLLARYRKGGKGRLVKMFLERILVDHAAIFLKNPPLSLNDSLLCPDCKKRVATIQVIKGKYAAKLNQGAIRQP
jgi:hypothetical protein